VTLYDTTDEWAVLAVYPRNNTEVYTFSSTEKRMTMVQTRYGWGKMNRGSLFVAACK
jgi:hypothetical protein